MLVLVLLQIRLVNRSPGGYGDVLHPRGHHCALYVSGAGFLQILPGSPVAEGNWQGWACAAGGSLCILLPEITIDFW